MVPIWEFERERYSYLLTYSFPCQDISLAGKKAGFTKGSKTRSGLLWEVERLLDECYPDLPQYLLMENVPQVISKKNKPDFDLWCKKLESLGYKNFYKLLNAKDYGIPQNRKRCFMVSILDQNANYQFPEPMELKLTLMDLLEDKVDEKYYLSDKILASFKAYNDRNEAKGNGFRFKPIPRERAISHSILASTGRQCDTYVYEPERERERERSVARSQHQQAGLTRSTYLMKRTVVKPTDVAATLMSAYRGLVNTEYLNVVEEDRSKASGKD